jgi:hypothetical protein
MATPRNLSHHKLPSARSLFKSSLRFIDDNYADPDGDVLEDEGLDEGLDLSKAERPRPIKHMRLVSDEVARHEGLHYPVMSD